MTTSKASPSLKRGKVYCLESFQDLLQQWLEDEVRRHLQQQLQRTSGRRVQPPRTAKDGMASGDYTIPEEDVTEALKGYNSQSEAQSKSARESRAVLSLRKSVLRSTVERKTRLENTYQPPMGVRHACTVRELHWDCAQLDCCAHSVIESAMKMVPAKTDDNLRCRLRQEFEELAEKNKDGIHEKELQPLRKTNVLRKRVLSRIAQLRTEAASRCDAPMLPSPSLGLWATDALPMEDLDAQTVECLGLKFAVDVCRGSGQCRVLML